MPRAAGLGKKARLRQPKVFHREGHFPFMDLPAEIRLMIYRFALAVNLDRLILLENGVQVRRTHKDRGAQSISHQLLQVSPVVYSEALPVLYGDNFFRFKDFKPLELFLEQIGSGRRWIKSLELETFAYGRLHEIKRTALVLLSETVVLKTFLISGCLQYGTREHSVSIFCKRMAAFLLKMGATKKSLPAAIGLLKFGASAFPDQSLNFRVATNTWEDSWEGVCKQDREAWFRDELLRHLGEIRGRKL